MKSYSIKMTPEQFIEKIVNLYHEARHSSFYHPKVKRGRSHTISAKTEDLLAAFLGFNLIDNYDIYVDQPISIENINKQHYPDIIISKNGEIKSFIDLKMDLGWNRDGFVNFCEQKNFEISQLKNKSYSLKEGLTKNISTGFINNNIKYHIVIISNQNISKTKFDRNIEETKNFENVKVYCLTSNIHPNIYADIDFVVNNIVVHNNSFEELMNNV